jgi:hypothetical protein
MQTPERPAVDALYLALKDAAPEITFLPPTARASLLKCTVIAAVDELKRLGLTSAQVESVVLGLVQQAWPLWAAGTEAADEIRAWCIQRYYDPRA